MEETIKSVEKRNGEFINIILSYAVENYMSFTEIESCIAKVKEVYLSDGLIKNKG